MWLEFGELPFERHPGSQLYFAWYASPPPGAPGPNDEAALARYPALITHVYPQPSNGDPLVAGRFVMFHTNTAN